MMQMAQPLNGIKVVELATFVAAPACGRALADWGAEVIKIEGFSGDPMRRLGALVGMPIEAGENIAFDQQNSNKHGIALNLKNPEGMAVLYRMLESADVFLTNYREESLKKLGLSYDQLRERYPALVYGHMLGYGEKGPDRDRPGYDFTSYYARGGISGTLYEKGGVPMTPVAAFGDCQAGLYLAGGISAALLQAKLAGRGEKVSVSLLHTAIFGMSHSIASSQYGNNFYPRHRTDNVNPLQGIYKTKDGRWFQLAIAEYDKELPRVCKLLGREDLLENQRLRTFDCVKHNPAEMFAELDQEFAKKDADEWIKLFNELDLACDKAMVWHEILEDEQAWANEMLVRVTGCSGGEDRIAVKTPVRFQNMGSPDFQKGPQVGQHTDQVLREHGFSPEEIQALRKKGSVS